MFWKKKPTLEPVSVGPMDPHGLAIREHQTSGKEQYFECRNLSDSSLRMPLCSSMYVMPGPTQTAIVEKAVSMCKGRVLDVGAGAGYASLQLQKAGFDVSAIDVSAYCVEAMRAFGVEKVEVGDVKHFAGGEFDTYLFLDSTIGCIGQLQDIEKTLAKLRARGSAHAQLIIQDGIADAGILAYEWQAYFQYQHYVGEPFSWFSVSATRLEEIGSRSGWELTDSYQHQRDVRKLLTFTVKS